MKSTEDEKLDALILKIKSPEIRTMLGICENSRKYPKDCITDGGLEVLVGYILKLEKIL